MTLFMNKVYTLLLLLLIVGHPAVLSSGFTDGACGVGEEIDLGHGNKVVSEHMLSTGEGLSWLGELSLLLPGKKGMYIV